VLCDGQGKRFGSHLCGSERKRRLSISVVAAIYVSGANPYAERANTGTAN
jgi:hypothetical protein